MRDQRRKVAIPYPPSQIPHRQTPISFPRKEGNKIIKQVNINDKIRAPQIRLIGVDGTQLGIVTRAEALARAAEEKLDLVEVAPKAAPPVCKIMDYGKYKYLQSKKLQEAKKKQVTIQVKEVKIAQRPRSMTISLSCGTLYVFLTRKTKQR